MPNSTLLVAGSIHQAHDRFSEISRGRQCCFISFSALLCAQSCPVPQWTASTVDQILTQGDKMYLDALESRAIPDTETISLTYLPDRARWSLPIEANKSNQSPVEANKPNQSPIEAQTNNQSPIRVTNTQLPIVVEPSEAQNQTNDNPLWLIKYKDFYQGRLTRDEHKNEAPYYTLRSALMNAFSNNNYAFIILDGYIMALFKCLDCLYLFDSHARNCFGMPDPNGTAVVMKCADQSIRRLFMLSFT